MPVSLTCTACKAALKLRDEFAGKRIKCPKCGAVLKVPAAELEELAPVEIVPEEQVRGRLRRRQPEPELEEIRGAGIQKERGRARRRDDDLEEDAPDVRRKRRKGGGDYKPCPECGAEGATRVMWTPWGSFYGPAMFSHVRCPECRYCYNGKTGRSNMIPAVCFVTVTVVGIVALLGAIVWVLIDRRWLTF